MCGNLKTDFNISMERHKTLKKATLKKKKKARECTLPDTKTYYKDRIIR